ncbi:MAG: hypothetical protein GC160_28675 [Acidobacteria bacterium]|nr:hypothetical protein [Acidobacteriota bacterium]
MRPLVVVSLAAAALLAGSCGQVGAPLPPLLNIPARAENVRAQQVEDRVVVRWTAPLLTTEGAALKNLSRFIVYAVEIAKDGPPAAPEALAPHFKTVGDVPATGESLEVPAVGRYGQRTAFAVRAITTKGKMSLWSNLAVLDLTAPPEAPAGLAATATADGVALEWTAAQGATAGYLIERSTGSAATQVVGNAAGPAYVDSSARFGTAYEYRVRGRAESPSGSVPGPSSESVAITPRDEFPPRPPQGLRGVRAPQSVELAWSSSSEPDLAGYTVERDGRKLHEGLLTAPAFSDAGAPAPAAYEVRAVDQNGNRSEAASITVE